MNRIETLWALQHLWLAMPIGFQAGFVALGSDYELREDGWLELREDGSMEVRDGA